MAREYFGDAAIGNRLFAARLAAGLRSGRAAASKFGLSASLLRAHETAIRAIDDDKLLKQYARAFRVSEAWLLTGEGDGPAVDPKRLERIYRRNAVRDLEAPLRGAIPASAKRLRVARRLAGHRTLTAASKRFGWNRTTASSHEAGQNAISAEWARAYRTAYGANAEWILHGTLPSGYPPEIEPVLDALGELHGEPEGSARDHFPVLKLPSRLAVKPPMFSRGSGKALRSRPAEDVAEIVVADLIRAIEQNAPLKRQNQHRVSLPPKYLTETLGCVAQATIVIPSPNDFGRVRIGDRLFVDMSQTNADLKGTYVALRRDGTLAMVDRSDSPGRDDVVIGRLAAVLQAFEEI